LLARHRVLVASASSVSSPTSGRMTGPRVQFMVVAWLVEAEMTSNPLLPGRCQHWAL
jgi:hypothetical protein